MKRKMRTRRESGQAMLELALLLVALAALTLGIITATAIALDNNRELLEAKFESERKARRAGSVSVDTAAEGEIYGWEYSELKFGTDTVADRIPFLPGDRRIKSPEGSLDGAWNEFTYSARSGNPAEYRYEWKRSGFEPVLKSDFSDRDWNAFDAAKLVRGEPPVSRVPNDASDHVYMPVTYREQALPQ